VDALTYNPPHPGSGPPGARDVAALRTPVQLTGTEAAHHTLAATPGPGELLARWRGGVVVCAPHGANNYKDSGNATFWGQCGTVCSGLEELRVYGLVGVLRRFFFFIV
jgi:hypothetical protein